MNWYLGQYLLMVPGLLVVLGNLPPAQAISNSNNVFLPYIDQIKTNLVPGLLFRLPSEIPSLDSLASQKSDYSVKVSPSLVNSGITVSIFDCKLESQACLIGNFSVSSPTASGSKEEFNQHQNIGSGINLNNQIRGYLINGLKQNPPAQFSSIMWKQDSLIYRIRFRDKNPENILAMANSMAKSVPINKLSNNDNLSVKNSSETSNLSKPNLPIKPNSDNTRTSAVEFTKPSIKIKPTVKVKPPAITEITSKPKIALLPIRSIQIKGNTVFSEDKFNSIVQEVEGKDFTQQEYIQTIQNITDKINALYQKDGYIAAAKPSENDPNRGIIQINITESYLKNIRVEGTQQLKSYVLNRLQLSKTEIINTAKIEDKLRLLKQDSLFTDVIATIKPLNNHEKELVVTVKEAPTVAANVSVDNFSPATVGSERVNVGLNYRNLTGLGDEFSANSTISNTGGNKLFAVGYQVPLNAMNGSLQLSATFNSTKVTQSPFDVLNIQGEKQIYEIFYRQPLIRSSTEELALSLGLSIDNGQTFIFDKPTGFGFGPDKDGVSRTSVVAFRQDYRKSDISGNWFLGSEFKIGTGLFNPTTNDSPVPDGYFLNWSGSLQREQRLSDSNSLLVRANAQITPDSLLPSQQFIIGGGQSVRGYRQNARSGDNGLSLSIEDRISLNSNFQIAPFLDLGTVWNVANNPNQLSSQPFLISSGLGIIWKPFKFIQLRLDYAFPFINLQDKGNNIQDDGLYFNINVQPYF
ncbi:MAG: ShlB/FhaC/HecB family hemolysin secretion/activation protein [Nostocales cyanobacterium W4_Combined_metabat2_030]|jgi:hemolysin activation/secretion protein|nr:ShlB/FhaC/HecB family hemolysin secretion/activation protein [Nostocales cyanobacterium W4_Combined_metabat2_030]